MTATKPKRTDQDRTLFWVFPFMTKVNFDSGTMAALLRAMKPCFEI
jgi:hypothetical protein